jgi:hypothetical protein
MSLPVGNIRTQRVKDSERFFEVMRSSIKPANIKSINRGQITAGTKTSQQLLCLIVLSLFQQSISVLEYGI